MTRTNQRGLFRPMTCNVAQPSALLSTTEICNTTTFHQHCLNLGIRCFLPYPHPRNFGQNSPSCLHAVKTRAISLPQLQFLPPSQSLFVRSFLPFLSAPWRDPGHISYRKHPFSTCQVTKRKKGNALFFHHRTRTRSRVFNGCSTSWEGE